MPDHRPRAHLGPRTGWTNDPTGPVRWRGRLHLFHQSNPDGVVWHRPRWGHLVSDDGVRWRRLPDALVPAGVGPDADGCWSGSAVVADDRAVIAFTGVRERGGDRTIQATCLASSRHPELRTWRREPSNPVLRPPPGTDLVGYRDPFLWWEAGRWWSLTGAGLRGLGGTLLLASATRLPDFRHHGAWLTDRDLAGLPGGSWTAPMWECPQLLRGRDQDALVLSLDHSSDASRPVAVVGQRTRRRFLPAAIQPLDLGDTLYAPCILQEPDGTATAWGWCREAIPEDRRRRNGWAGALSAPRRLAVANGRLTVGPHPAVTGLRTRVLDAAPAPTDRGWRAPGLDGTCLDLELELGPAADRVELHLRRSPTGAERTVVSLDRAAGHVRVDRSRASLDPAAAAHPVGGELGPGAPLRHVRVLLDNSLLEVFIDEQVALTTRIYPTRDDSRGVEVVGAPAAVADVRLSGYELGTIWAGADEDHRTG